MALEARHDSAGILATIISEIGAPSFFNAFFSTVNGLLENGVAGSCFPVSSNELYEGHVDARTMGAAIAELQVIQKELMAYPPIAIIWDSDDRSKAPPWGHAISSTITSMGNYFVSSTGRDLFGLLIETFRHALKQGRPVDIVDTSPFGKPPESGTIARWSIR